MSEDHVTKSIRLAPDESASLHDLAERLQCSESSLLRRFALEGLRQVWLDEGILAYTKGRATESQAADLARLPETEFVEQLRLRGILGPGYLDGDPSAFLDGVQRLAHMFGDENLALAVDAVRSAQEQQAAVGSR